jgi:hypothetical protein
MTTSDRIARINLAIDRIVWLLLEGLFDDKA